MQESKETKKEIFSTLDRDGTQNEDWFLNQVSFILLASVLSLKFV